MIEGTVIAAEELLYGLPELRRRRLGGLRVLQPGLECLVELGGVRAETWRDRVERRSRSSS
jgi:hypothetical protein